MAHPTLFRAAATLAGVVTVVVTAATPALAAKKVPTSQPPTITSGPASGSFQPSRTATFAFKDAAAKASFQCKLDSGTAGTCKSPKTYTKLADGAHTFSVTATAPGKKASTATTRTWTVDLHVPAPPVVSSSQSNPTNQTKRPFTFTGETGATFQCAIDGAAFAACSTPFTTPTVSNGGHVFAVKQVARNGLASSATSVGWDVDTATPGAPVINSGPTGTVNTSDNTFTFSNSSPDATVFQCSVAPPGNVSDCSSGSYSTGALADGGYVFHVFAKDAAGNQSPEATRSYTIDHTAAASPVITSHPAAITKLTTAAFNVTGALTCTFDAQAPVDCSSGTASASGLADGQHTFTANNGAPSTSYTWTVDTVAPAAPTFVTAPAQGSSTNVTSSVVALASDASSVLSCTVDGSARACPGFLQLTNLPNGVHTIVATATDAAGNTATATRSWTVDTVAPHAAIAAPATLTAPAVVTFSEAVRAAGATVASLVLTNTAQVVPTVQSCRSGSVVVACSTAAFGSVRLAPTRALTAGQHYTVRVASGAVHDAATNSNPAAALNFRGQRSLQEGAAGVNKTWQRVGASAALGGSFVREHLAGAQAVWTFKGTSVTWWTVTGPNQGRAYLYVDGVRKAVNNYAAGSHFHVARTVGKLANKSHRVQIVVRGLKGAKAGKGTFVAVDGFTVGTTTTATPALTTTWRVVKSTHLSGGAASVADLARSQLQLVFRGTGISWYTVRGPAQGKAQIWLDGVLKTTVDNYAASTKYGVARSLTKLSDKLHTLKIVVLGKHRAGAKGNTIEADRFLVA